ncbi:MAG TPA: hypothetical protein VGV59_08445 [Pyrinomonadaceae bacterium]|nr:hypothetical protein [Pyrinomonadaceae bacterium]
MPARTRHAPALLLVCALACAALPFAATAQTGGAQALRADTRRALASRQPLTDVPARAGAYRPPRGERMNALRAQTQTKSRLTPARRAPIRPTRSLRSLSEADTQTPAAPLARLRAGTPLSRVLHTSQLSLVNASGTNEQFADQTADLVADERTTFDAQGGSYDIAVGRSGARYEVFSSIDTKGTTTLSDDVAIGVLVIGQDSNGDYMRDPGTPPTFDLHRDFQLPSAVSVVSGTSSTGREFVVVSSSGFYDSTDPNNPDNEPSPGVILLVRNATGVGFDPARSRALVRVGDDQLFNANALALLPTGDLLVADFQSNEIRIIRDRDGDRVPDTLDAKPFYSFRFSDDAPLDIAANSRGVVFSHSVGADTFLLALYDTDGDGYADTDETAVEGLSIDNNLVLHGLTVGRDGTVYLIEDASGEHDRPADGGNGGIPRIDAFPDPALNGILRDGEVFAEADDEFTQALSGLSFGVETQLAPVARLTLTNSASLRGAATFDGLATIQGTGLTRGLRGLTEGEAAAHGLRVTVEGRSVPVLSFADSQIHIFLPKEVGAGVGSVVVTVNGSVIAADDARIVRANPGLFTTSQTGAGQAIALLASGLRYTQAPFPSKTNGAPSTIALFGTGWRNSLPVSATVGGRAATVQYAGASGTFPGLDQLNVLLPEGTPPGTAAVVVTCADGSTSRTDVTILIQ